MTFFLNDNVFYDALVFSGFTGLLLCILLIYIVFDSKVVISGRTYTVPFWFKFGICLVTLAYLLQLTSLFAYLFHFTPSGYENTVIILKDSGIFITLVSLFAKHRKIIRRRQAEQTQDSSKAIHA